MNLSGKQKAVAAFVISAVFAVITWALATFPDNTDVQHWGTAISGLISVLAITAGVHQVKNVPYHSGNPVSKPTDTPPAA